mmetsp:Transcript_97843/g.276790  ORF Transcript_97843/g.276790 Transcript_97843/m.276790 type:complete len:305 (+) Transcript_97843:502-1416(+)
MVSTRKRRSASEPRPQRQNACASLLLPRPRLGAEPPPLPPQRRSAAKTRPRKLSACASLRLLRPRPRPQSVGGRSAGRRRRHGAGRSKRRRDAKLSMTRSSSAGPPRRRSGRRLRRHDGKSKNKRLSAGTRCNASSSRSACLHVIPSPTRRRRCSPRCAGRGRPRSAAGPATSATAHIMRTIARTSKGRRGSSTKTHGTVTERKGRATRARGSTLSATRVSLRNLVMARACSTRYRTGSRARMPRSCEQRSPTSSRAIPQPRSQAIRSKIGCFGTRVWMSPRIPGACALALGGVAPSSSPSVLS